MDRIAADGDHGDTLSPGIVDLGHISDLTRGTGGSSCDGSGDLTQRGGGNDDAVTDCGPPGGGNGNAN